VIDLTLRSWNRVRGSVKKALLVQESSQFLLSRQGFEPCL
jgi:hypothetical protein